MNTIKCKYDWDDGTVELLFSDGTTIALLCKGIEADLSIGIVLTDRFFCSIILSKVTCYAQLIIKSNNVLLRIDRI